MRRMLPLLPLLFAAAACVSAPAPEAAAPLPPLARAALEEWRSWGGIVVEGWPEARPAGQPGQVGQHGARGQMQGGKQVVVHAAS